MKSKERHHLKENELAHSIRATQDFVSTRGRQVTGLLVVLLLVAVVIGGIVVMRQRTRAEAQQALGEAMAALNAPVVPATPAAGAFSTTSR